MRALGPRAALLLLLAARSAARRLDDEHATTSSATAPPTSPRATRVRRAFVGLRLGRAMRRVSAAFVAAVQRHLRPLPGVHRYIGGELFGLVL